MEDSKPPVQQVDISAERLVRCIPVAKEVLKMIADANLPIGILSDEEVNTSYKEISLKVMALFLQHDLNYVDRNFVFQLVNQATDLVGDKVLVNLETSFNLASNKVWGKDIQDLKLKDINNVLMKQNVVDVV